MEHDNANTDPHSQWPLIQLLIPACQATAGPGTHYAWLNGYCLINCKVGADEIVLSGEVRIGDHLAENFDLISGLAAALDPSALLAGWDLHGTLSALGRLPIDAINPAPALDLLTKIKSMLRTHTPIDLGITPDSRDAVLASARFWNLGGGGGGISYKVGQLSSEGVGSGNPRLLAEMLADEGSACLLALGQLFLTQVPRVKMDTAWQRWRRSVVPIFPAGEGLPIVER